MGSKDATDRTVHLRAGGEAGGLTCWAKRKKMATSRQRAGVAGLWEAREDSPSSDVLNHFLSPWAGRSLSACERGRQRCAAVACQVRTRKEGS